MSPINFEQSHNTAAKLKEGLKQLIQGRDDTIKLVITALLAGGHVLIEDYPGSGKTTLAKTLGNLISDDSQNKTILPFRRIQFTPDLLPGDILGVNIFDPKNGNFQFIPGPVFAHMVLADEINRTGPKVQAAFLECMAEKQVTLDNQTHKLDDLFFVIGTQNPLDFAGTYPLPLVQLDRFLLKIPMSYVDSETEKQILRNHGNITTAAQSINAVCTRSEIINAQKAVDSIQLNELIREAIVDFVQLTRNSAQCLYGLSTRSAIMLQQALRAWALIEGRDYVTEDDFKSLAPFVFMHRLKFHAGGDEEAVIFNDLITPIVDKLVTKGLKNL